MALLGFYHNVVPSEAVLLVNRLYVVKNSVSLESRHVLPDGKLHVDSLRINWMLIDYLIIKNSRQARRNCSQ